MRRRLALLLAVGLLAAPLVAEAQQGARTARVGVLVPGPPDPQADETYNAFRQGLRERGWIEGQNLVLDFRYAYNQYDRLPALARELVALQPDAIFAVASPAIQAAIQATGTIPIVIETLGDALSAGLVPDLARPGGNVTGVSGFAPELIAKRLQIIREILPKADSISVLANLANPTSPPVVRATEAAGRCPIASPWAGRGASAGSTPCRPRPRSVSGGGRGRRRGRGAAPGRREGVTDGNPLSLAKMVMGGGPTLHDENGPPFRRADVLIRR